LLIETTKFLKRSLLLYCTSYSCVSENILCNRLVCLLLVWMVLHIHYHNQRKLPYAFLCLLDRMTFYPSCEPSKSSGIKCWHFSRIWAWSRHDL